MADHTKKWVYLFSEGNAAIRDLLGVAAKENFLAVDDKALSNLQATRKQIMEKSKLEPIYGFNMGFGQHQDVPVSADQLDQLQTNLIRSHAVSFGDPAPEKVVRLAMSLRVATLARGHSGVRPEVIKKLVDLINRHDIYPYVPKMGSLGASGDLAPMSHIALTLIGEGLCYFNNELKPTAEVFNKLGIEPLKLEAKEGLALNNGMQFSTAYLTYLADKAYQQMELSLICDSCLTEIMLGTNTPFLPPIQAMRPYPGQIKAGQILTKAMEGSQILLAHKSYEFDKNTQDPYSSRCLPQVYGTFFDAYEDTIKKLQIEMNSATDNPLIFEGEVISGGNFHGMPIAIAAANLFNTTCAGVKISEALVRRIVDKDKNRLGVSCLISKKADKQTSSGMMIVEYSFESIVNLLMSLNSSTFLHSATSASGQEDHVSHAPTVILNYEKALELLDILLAIKLYVICQGYYILSEIEPDLINEKRIAPDSKLVSGKAGQLIQSSLKNYFCPIQQDKFMQPEIDKILNELVKTGEIYKILI